MLALDVHFLTDRYVATTYNDRQTAEWPPHPARVYAALVAALHGGEHDERGRDALRWLAAAGPPQVWASDAFARGVTEIYVPVNDVTPLGSLDKYLNALSDAEAANASEPTKKAWKKLEKAQKKVRDASDRLSSPGGRGKPSTAAELLPSGRSKQPRTFPVALPHVPRVRLVWPDPPEPALVDALDRVAADVNRLGHSSTLVSVTCTLDQADAPEDGLNAWHPEPTGDLMLRVPTEGQLERLEAAHAIHQAVEPRVLPAGFVRYGRRGRTTTAARPRSVFSDEWVAFRVVAGAGGRRRLLDVSLTERVTRGLRGWLLSQSDGDWPASLSGHDADGNPTGEPHLGFVALPDVGHYHATGSLLGVALLLPRDLSPDDRRVLLRAVARGTADGPVILTLGRSGEVHLERLTRPDPRKTLQAATWSGPSRRWATVTPVALDRNPGDLTSRDPAVVDRAVAAAEQTIARACTHVGLPEPAAVWVHRRPMFDGTPAARRFAPYPREARGHKRVCVHAEVLFDQPVQGPIALGAGRYFGIGLMRPLGDR